MRSALRKGQNMSAQHRLSANNHGTQLQVAVGDDIYVDLSAHLPDEWRLNDPVKWMFAQLGSSPLAFGPNSDENRSGFIVTSTLHLVASAPGTETVEIVLVNPYSAGLWNLPVPSQTLRFDVVVR